MIQIKSAIYLHLTYIFNYDLTFPLSISLNIILDTHLAGRGILFMKVYDMRYIIILIYRYFHFHEV